MLICRDLTSSAGCGAVNALTSLHCRQCGRSLRHALRLHEPGQQLAGYTIVRLIGHGGFGAVYEAMQAGSGERRVALKQTIDASGIAQFRAEFAVLQRLQHANLPEYYAFFEHDGNGYLAMEFVPGQSLQDLLAARAAPLLERQVLGFAMQLCDALSYLHSRPRPVLHRDIKPANIRLTPDGVLKLVDFGLVKEGTETTQLASRGLSLAYAPIEQYTSSSNRTAPQTDIYSLGATLYHLLTATAPVAAPERVAQAPDPLTPPRQLNPRLSEHVATAVLKAMALVMSERFSDADAFLRALTGASMTDQTLRMGAIAEAHGQLVITESRPQVQAPGTVPGTRRPYLLALGLPLLLFGLTLAIFAVLMTRSSGSGVAAPSVAATLPVVVATRAGEAGALVGLPTTPLATRELVVASAVPAQQLPTLQLASAAPTAAAVQNLSALAVAGASSILPPEQTQRFGLVRFDPANVLDGDPASAWVEGVAGPGLGEQLSLSFAQPLLLTRIGIIGGYDRDETIFFANHRVRELELRFSDGSSETVQLQDQRGLQYFEFAPRRVQTLTLVIRQIYASSTYDDTPIAEVQIWGSVSP